MREEEVGIASKRSTGAVELEGRLHLPEGGARAPGVVVCHPHPAGGGEMAVPLVRHLAREMASRGFVALRFNFAGVGASGGTFTDGAEEPGDVKAAFDFLSGRWEVDPEAVSLAGWSFGAWMALLALADGLTARACVAIAPPLMAYEWAECAGHLASSTARRFYIVGESDQFCPAETMERFTAAVSPEETSNLQIIRGADHFLFGVEQEVVALAADFLAG